MGFVGYNKEKSVVKNSKVTQSATRVAENYNLTFLTTVEPKNSVISAASLWKASRQQ